MKKFIEISWKTRVFGAVKYKKELRRRVISILSIESQQTLDNR